MKKIALLVLLGGVVAAVALSLDSPPRAPKVVVLGIDGMDPRLLQQFMDSGDLPHFKELAAKGGFTPLQTTMPPLSPVAWSTFITGTLPQSHGVFDFLHRDPVRLLPESAMARTTPPGWTLSLGSWVIPLEAGKIEQLRQGRAFWEYLSERDIPATIFRMPVNFPPVEAGRALSGMGTPDLLGTSGTFTFFTSGPVPEHEVSGGRIVPVEVESLRVVMKLEGPPNTFRLLPSTEGKAEHPFLATELSADLDPEHPAVRLQVQGRELVLQEGEWSDWVPLEFEAIPYLVTVHSACRFHLQQVRPDFRLYVSPLQISPASPAMPITYPADWAGDLHRRLGLFYTQELAEETKGFSSGILSGREFWEQSQFVYREQRRMLDRALEEFRDGFLFFYFSSVDQGCHMLWRYSDAAHPAYVEDPLLSGSIGTLYREMDEALGRILAVADDDTTLIVMSDHGFAPFYWEVNLNSWLLDRGYVRLEDPTRRDGFTAFANVDWSGTRAYAVGLNGLYVNLRGREGKGIVSQGREYEALLDRLEQDLLGMVDPRNGNRPVSFVLRSGDAAGAAGRRGPDLIVGYAYGYRSSWKSPLGEFPLTLFQDNLDPWSGDHSMDYRQVPGILLSNRRITLPDPALYDLTVAVLDEYGIARPAGMMGQDCLE